MPKSWRFAPAMAVTAAAALLLAAIALVFSLDQTYKSQKASEITAQARILAATVTAALEFDDRKAAQEYVDAFRANPELQAVAIYALDGSLFAGYPQAAGPSLPGPDAPAASQSGLLTVSAPVMLQDGKPVGSVYLRSVIEPLHRRLQRYAVVGLLLLMAALMMGVLGIAQSALGHANEELQRRARDLAAANQMLRDEVEQREKAEAALRQAQKMEAIGQLTGGIAHDFNNILQIIIGSLDRLRTRKRRAADQEGEVERLAGAAMQGAQRAAALTQRLLAFSRQQPLDPKPVQLNDLLRGMSEMLIRTLGEAIHIELALAGDPWPVLVDENQMESAVLNLAVNARDAMPAGGKLTIETANVRLEAGAAGTDEDVKPGMYAMVAVTDTGTGMTADVRDKAFDPFFTTKDIGQGTGLGLSQVYGFIRQSGGHVRIDSEIGKGTTIRLYLPRLLAAGSGAEADPVPRTVPRGESGECILVVEDEDQVRSLTVNMLRELGYRVLDAPDGAAAQAILERGAQVDLLFTDIGLPGGMNGRELADRVRTGRPGLRVLFTTGYAQGAIVHHGRLDPGVELIGKPFSVADLARKVRDVLDRDRRTVEMRPEGGPRA